MSIIIDQNLCIRCQSCVAMCPENFKANDSGDIEVISQEVTESAQNAALACPAQAIIIG